MTALAKLSSLEQSYDQARQEFEHIVDYLDAKETSGMTHSDLERELEKKGRELMRQLLQEHLNNRGPSKCDQPVCDADGVEQSRVRLQERELETIFGTVSIERTGYGRQGTKSLHPMDAELNLPNERYSLEMRRRVAEEAAKSSFDETLESIGKNTGGHIPKRQVEELVMRAAQDFDAFYQTRQPLSGKKQGAGSILAISVDGKGITMRTQDLRDQTRICVIRPAKPPRRVHTKWARVCPKGRRKIPSVWLLWQQSTQLSRLCERPKISLVTAVCPVRHGPVRSKSVCGPVSKKSPNRSLKKRWPKPAIETRPIKRPGLHWLMAIRVKSAS